MHACAHVLETRGSCRPPRFNTSTLPILSRYGASLKGAFVVQRALRCLAAKRRARVKRQARDAAVVLQSAQR